MKSTMYRMPFILLGLVFALSMACQKAEEAQTETANSYAADTESEPAQESNRGTATASFGQAKISINYGRPKLQGRDMLGQAKEGMVWRMGMNEATTIKTDVDLKFGETTIPKGEYSLFMKKVSGDKWELIFNKQTGQWGTQRKPENDLASIPMTSSTLEDSVETFTIEVTSKDDTSGSISAMWANAKMSCDFTIVR